jgi:outer membrane lipoprotein LolB
MIRVLAVAGVLLLFGCAGPEALEGRSLEQRAAQLAELHAWRFEGRLAVSDGRQSWQAGVNWRQRDESYFIDLIGPLGQGRLDIRGDADGVTLRDGERLLSAAEPETLLVRAGIAPVPIAGLRHWLLGLPTPNGSARRVVGDDGLLRRLQQDGWEIVYVNYTTVADIAMPQRIDARRTDTRHGALDVRLLINRWTLG